MSQTNRTKQLPISLLIVEDHDVILQGLQAVLKPHNDQVEIVGMVTTAQDAIAFVEEAPPDLVLLDLRLPKRRGVFNDPDVEHGLATIVYMRSAAPNTRILVLTTLSDPETLFAALGAGAHGYITKSDEYNGARLMHAFEATVNGEVVFGPTLGKLILETMRDKQAPNERLTARELEVLDLIVAGLTNAEIAERLGRSEKTIKTHVSNILAKLHVSTRAEARMHVLLGGLKRTTT